MKIYCAASIHAKATAQAHADTLRRAGHDPTSRWHRPGFIEDQLAFTGLKLEDEEFQQRMGTMDYDDLVAAEALFIDSRAPSSSGGFCVELGIALQTIGLRVYLLGPRPNVFFYLPEIRPVVTIEELCAILR